MSPRNSREASPYHALSTDAVLEYLDSTEDGLSADEARKRRKQNGPNRLRKQKRKSVFRIFIEQINNPVIYLLAAATGAAFIFGDIAEGMAIIVVIILNTAIGFWMEMQARKSMRALQNMDRITATVVRGGERQEVDAERLVPGDVLIIEAGDLIPADARVLKAAELRIDESPLTGESVPVAKSKDPVKENAALGDRSGAGICSA